MSHAQRGICASMEKLIRSRSICFCHIYSMMNFPGLHRKRQASNLIEARLSLIEQKVKQKNKYISVHLKNDFNKSNSRKIFTKNYGFTSTEARLF